jgi:HEAT repeat protein
MARAASRDLHGTLGDLFEHAEVVSLAGVEGSLVVNGVPYPPRRQESLVKGLLEQFRKRELRGFTIRQGLTESEAMFLVTQLASHEAVERDPEVWEALLEERGIENVDFGDRVYVPAEGVAHAPVDSAGLQQPSSGVVRVAGTEELAGVFRESLGESQAEPLPPGPGPVAAALPVSPEDLKSLLSRLEADASIDAEIETLVPIVADLLRKLLENAGESPGLEDGEWMRASGAEPTAETPAVHDEVVTRSVVRDADGARESSGPGIAEIGDLPDGTLGEGRAQIQRLFGPAETHFEACVHGGMLGRATSILRFLRLCERLDDGGGELTAASRESLVGMARGESVPVLLADLAASPEDPDPRALELLRDLGDECGSVLATFVRETDDLRARRVIARTLRDLGGESLVTALDSITHGDNPVVARRVIAVLDDLSVNLGADLERAVTVRNPAVLGEAIKVLQRQPRRLQLQVIGSLLESASPELVCRGVYYLSEWNFTEARDSVLMLLRESEDLEVLAGVTAALARWRLPEAVPVLAELLRRKQVMKIVPVFPRGLRREFARALAAIDTPEARRELREFVKDVDAEVRNIARGLPAPSGA